MFWNTAIGRSYFRWIYRQDRVSRLNDPGPRLRSCRIDPSHSPARDFASPVIGILIAVMIYAVGGGLLEVFVSPVVEACPSENKEKAMSMLHSF